MVVLWAGKPYPLLVCLYLFFFPLVPTFTQQVSSTADTLSQQQFITGCAKYRESVIHEIETALTSFVQLSDSLAITSAIPEAHIRFRNLIVKAILPENHEMSTEPIRKVVRELFNGDPYASVVYENWIDKNGFALEELGFLSSVGLLERDPPYRLTSSKELWLETAFYGFRSGMTIADIGAGNGFLSFILLNSGLKTNLILTEIDEEFIALLKVKIAGYHSGSFSGNTVLLKTGTDKELGLKDEKVDCMIFREVFHHLSDPMSILLDAKAHLNEGGYIVLAEQTIDLEPQKSERCNKATTYEKIMKTMNKAGFTLVDQEIIDRSYMLKFKPGV